MIPVLDLEIVSRRLSPAKDNEVTVEGSQLYNVSLDCILSNRSC